MESIVNKCMNVDVRTYERLGVIKSYHSTTATDVDPGVSRKTSPAKEASSAKRFVRI